MAPTVRGMLTRERDESSTAAQTLAAARLAGLGAYWACVARLEAMGPEEFDGVVWTELAPIQALVRVIDKVVAPG